MASIRQPETKNGMVAACRQCSIDYRFYKDFRLKPVQTLAAA
ncbi:hypothetical protein [Kingella sp. (in: b-proteobacteria)]|nr:hypothetical protein [Kingella sp. (in: b-proteobacteria)]